MVAGGVVVDGTNASQLMLVVETYGCYEWNGESTVIGYVRCGRRYAFVEFVVCRVGQRIREC